MTDPTPVIVGSVALGLVLAALLILLLVRVLAGASGWRALVKRWGAAPRGFVAHQRGVRALRHPKGVPIERLAADLRRLRSLVQTDAHSSAAHQLGNRLAYDRLLTQACAMLDIPHELDKQSSGLDRDIERLRVEAELERAGVVLSERGYGQAA